MGLALLDRVRETTTTTGTGTITLAGAVTGYVAFSTLGTVDTYYVIAGQGTSEWELGIGGVSGSSLTRSAANVIAGSSGAGTLVSFSAGTKDVYACMPAPRLFAPGGMINRLRNPKMEVAQRGATFVSPAHGTYTVDGWSWVNSSAGAVTITQNTDVPTNAEYQYSLRVAVTTADASVGASDRAALLQPVEGYLVRDMQGVPVGIQFDVRSTKTGTHCVTLINSGSDRSYIFTYTINTTNTWEKKYLLLPGGLITAGTWNWTTGVGLYIAWTMMCGSTYQTTAGAWQTGNFWGTSAQVNCMDSTSNIFAIGMPQIERGVPGPLEHRSIADETIFNYRYYQQVTGNVRGWIGTGGSSIDSNVTWSPMRTTPTVSTYSAGSSSNVSSNTFYVQTNTGGRSEITGTSINEAYLVNYVFALTAEL